MALFLLFFTSLFGTERYDLVGLSAAIMDHSVHIADDELSFEKGSWTPISLEEMEALLKRFEGRVITGPGGSGTNLVKGVARLGKRCAVIGQIGCDAIGKAYERRLGECNIQALYTKQSLPTGQSICMITPDGQRTMRTYLGSSHVIGTTSVDKETLAKTDWLHIEGYQLIDESLVKRVVHHAKQLGVKISLDFANPFIIEQHRRTLQEILPQIDLLFCNESEALAYTGLESDKAIAQLGTICPTVVVTCSEKGCFVSQDGKVIKHPANIVPVIDTTGAGDFFAGGFLAATIGKCPAIEAAKMGTLLASQVIQVTGADLTEDRWKAFGKELCCQNLQ